MFTAFSRIIKYGLIGFWRSGWLSTATIIVMVLTLMVFEGLMIFNVVTKTAIESIQDKIDISAYFKVETPEDDILKIKNYLESLTEVKKVEYISRDKAMEIFRGRHKEEQAISEALGELKDNPFLASLNIKAYNSSDYASINIYLSGESLKNAIEKISYAQNSTVIERLTKIVASVKKAGVILTILFSAIAVLITFNTIRLAIYASREEISIMRLVGASNDFIRGPYAVEGIIYGLISGALSFILAAPIVYYLSPYFQNFIPELNLWKYFLSDSAKLIGLQVLFGIILGVISSTIAIRKYLRI